ncbi:sulfatase-like hydrolase/transferase [Providencia hangzhouensis]|uniref:sulfatase-like hydrolase/transferase n=1 Tax=Providencia hangzhouensis TaxID=3031799 RepID=UPI0034DCE981
MFKQELNQQVNKNQKRLFVIHLYGSHPNACARIEDYKNNYIPKNKNLHNVSCYVASIEKTDKILNSIYDLLTEQQKKTGRSFSMLYFSDYGVSHSPTDDEIKLNLSNISVKVLDIPLMIFNSDSHRKKNIRAYKSGKLFITGLANWLNIKNQKIDSDYSLFSETEDDHNIRRAFQYTKKFGDADIPIDIQNK